MTIPGLHGEGALTKVATPTQDDEFVPTYPPKEQRRIALCLEDVVGLKGMARKAYLEADALRLNIGCGFQQISGFVGVDFDADCAPDVVAPMDDLPWGDNEVDDIYASHCLEHVPMDSPALNEWFRVLKPGGMLTVAVPDIVQTYYLWKHGAAWGDSHAYPISELYLNAVAFGAHLLEPEVPELARINNGKAHIHKQIFIGDMLLNRVLGAGFEEVHEVVGCFLRKSSIGETMVQGRKPRPGRWVADPTPDLEQGE